MSDFFDGAADRAWDRGIADDFFEDVFPRRDAKGRPLLIPRGQAERVPYMRASGIYDALEDKSFLGKWEARCAAKGLSMSPDLLELVAAEPY